MNLIYFVLVKLSIIISMIILNELNHDKRLIIYDIYKLNLIRDAITNSVTEMDEFCMYFVL